MFSYAHWRIWHFFFNFPPVSIQTAATSYVNSLPPCRLNYDALCTRVVWAKEEKKTIHAIHRDRYLKISPTDVFKLKICEQTKGFLFFFKCYSFILFYVEKLNNSQLVMVDWPHTLAVGGKSEPRNEFKHWSTSEKFCCFCLIAVWKEFFFWMTLSGCVLPPSGCSEEVPDGAQEQRGEFGEVPGRAEEAAA